MLVARGAVAAAAVLTSGRFRKEGCVVLWGRAGVREHVCSVSATGTVCLSLILPLTLSHMASSTSSSARSEGALLLESLERKFHDRLR